MIAILAPHYQVLGGEDRPDHPERFSGSEVHVWTILLDLDREAGGLVRVRLAWVVVASYLGEITSMKW